MIRSILAVLAGIAALTVASFALEAAADPLLMRMFPHALPNRTAISHNVPAMLFGLFYTSLSVTAGGYATAWIALRAPVRHATIMGVVEVMLTVWAMISLRNEAPLWNWIGAMLLTIPMASWGGLLRARQCRSVESACST